MGEVQMIPKEQYAYALRLLFKSIEKCDANNVEKIYLIDKIYHDGVLIDSSQIEKFKGNHELLVVCREITDYMLGLANGLSNDGNIHIYDAQCLRDYAEDLFLGKE